MILESQETCINVDDQNKDELKGYAWAKWVMPWCLIMVLAEGMVMSVMIRSNWLGFLANASNADSPFPKEVIW